MRLIALFGTLLLLSGCGFGTFLHDTHTVDTTFRHNPNEAIGNSETMQRVRGLVVQEAPLETDPGNVWPGPLPPVPTMSDLQKDTESVAPELGAGEPQNGQRPRARKPGSPAAPAQPPAVPAPATPPPANGPDNGGRVVVPNGNGTSTVIEPNGTVHTIPTPK